MKILHINSYYSGSIFYKNLFDKQINLGLNVDVFVPVSYSNISSNLALGDYTIVSPNHNKLDRFFFHLKQYKIYKDILSKLNIHDYSLTHAHSLFSNGYTAMKIKEEYGIPYVVAIRNTDVNVFFKHMINLRKLGIQILKEASSIIFLSETYRNLTIDNYVPKHLKVEFFKKSKIIPNGIDDFWLNHKGNRNKNISKDEVKLLYVGVINKNKNVLSTVKAIEILERKGIDATLTLVGKIEDNSIFRKVSEFPFVKYKTPRPKEELIEIYRSNDIFVMPSITETFGLVYAEAMSQAMPIIYSKGQGFDRQFNDGEVGYSVNAYSPEDIADKIEKILVNYVSISTNCVQLVEKFNWKSISDEYYKLYLKTV